MTVPHWLVFYVRDGYTYHDITPLVWAVVILNWWIAGSVAWAMMRWHYRRKGGVA